MSYLCPIHLLLFLGFLSPPCLSRSLPSVQLLQFRDSLLRSSQYLLPWDKRANNSSQCQWQGVLCYGNGNVEVQSLNLSGYGLSGELNDPITHICQLQYIVSLDLSRNNFTGGIPELLGKCGRLQTIILSDNSLQGSIPVELFQSNLLTKLDLVDNSLSGQFPKQITSCKRLEYLALANNFISGKIPEELFSLPLLKSLFINTNNLTGSLPDFPSVCRLTDLWIHQNNFSSYLPPTLSNCKNLTNFYAFSNQFKGEIPRETFAGLAKLEVLYLGQNRLEGEIPDTVWGLESLQVLVLSGNNFTSGIAEIGNCRQISFIDLSENSLVGEIPASIGNLKSLETLFLYDNKLQSAIPAEIGNCSSLTSLELHKNFINGSIPPEISNLENLSILYLFNNRLIGSIPQEVGKMHNLVELALYNNTLEGSIPMEITHLRKLEFLSLAFNRFTGLLPQALGKNTLSGLIRLDLTGNRLRGAIPPYICTGNKLSRLTLGHNQFNGSFPLELRNCSSLRRIILTNNHLQGNVLLAINPSVVYLDVGRNFLTGEIPAAFGSLSNLSMLDLSENGFLGSIPPKLGNLMNLQVLNLSSNKLMGTIPSALGRLHKLLEFDLSKNNLSGNLPIEIASSPLLQRLRLQENMLEGIIPDCFSSSHRLIELQLGGNMFEGTIPCSLSKPTQFSSVLNVSNNHLSGSIPKCLSELSMLQALDLSSNNFSGEIPPELNNMISLNFINISFNHFNGKLPDSWRKLTLQPESYAGNPCLCVLGSEEGCDQEEDGNFFSSLIGKLTIVVIGSVVFMCLFCTGVYVLCITRLGQMSLDDSLLSRSKTKELPDELNFEDIVKATEGWNNKYVIGRGKHGTVYRAKSLAAKKVNLSEGESLFNLEARTLSYVRHRNIVKMVGYCIRDGFGFIMTEYMPGGTLFEVLHKPEASLVLNWNCRFRIALGIAQGLDYLHRDCIPKIIHRDIKSANILLDPELEPKIGDFALAKLVSDIVISSPESVVVGTLGYIAPENGFSAQLTEKCDVYSYGVILLELLCRKMAVDPCFEEGLDIVSWTRKNLEESDECVTFLDEEISFWGVEDQRKTLELLDLGLACTETVVDMRPLMKDVVASLLKLNKR